LIVTDRAIFDALVGNQKLFTFDTPTECQLNRVNGSCDAKFDGFTLVWDLPDIPPDFTVKDAIHVNGTHIVQLILDQPVMAIGFDIVRSDGHSYQIRVSSGGVGAVTVLPATGFLGIIAWNGPITQLSLAPFNATGTVGGGYALGNVAISVPEPSTVTLLAWVGVAALLRHRRRLR
jgi:hypothetical protein